MHALRALAFLHARGLRHLALKASNVLLEGPPGRRVARLGEPDLLPWLQGSPAAPPSGFLDDVPRIERPAPEPDDEPRRGRPTRASDAADALAPELVTSVRPDRRADIYALGVALRRLPGRRLTSSLGSLIDRMTDDDPRKRPASANEAIAEINRLAGTHFEAEPAASGDTVLLSAPFVGRDREVAWFGDLLGRVAANPPGARAREAEPQVVVVTGETGTGKSRLLAEVSRRGADLGMAVITSRCWDVGEVACTPISDAVRAMAGRPELAPILERFASELPRLVPGLPAAREPERVPRSDSDGGGDEARAPDAAPAGVDGFDGSLLGAGGRAFGRGASREERVRLLQALAEFLWEASRDRPILLLIDDLHHADETTFEALRSIARAHIDPGERDRFLRSPPSTSSEPTDVAAAAAAAGAGAGRGGLPRVLVVATVSTDELFGLPSESPFREMLGASAVRELPLGRLDGDAVAEIVSNLLWLPTERETAAEHLGGLLARETEGNPLAVEHAVWAIADGTVREGGLLPAGLRRGAADVGRAGGSVLDHLLAGPRTPAAGQPDGADEGLLADDVFALLERRLAVATPEDELLLRVLAAIGRPVGLRTVAAVAERDVGVVYASACRLAERRLLRLVAAKADLEVELVTPRAIRVIDRGLDPRERRRLHERIARVLEAEAGGPAEAGRGAAEPSGGLAPSSEAGDGTAPAGGADAQLLLDGRSHVIAFHALRGDDVPMAVRWGLRAAELARGALAFRRAVTLLGTVLERLGEPEMRGDPEAASLEVRALCERAAANLASGRPTEARMDLERASERARKVGDARAEVAATVGLGRAFAEAGDRTSARRRLDAGLERAIAADLPGHAARCRIELALVDHADGLHDRALEVLTEAEGHLQAVGARSALAWALREGARVLFEAGRLDRAIEKAARAREIYEAERDRPGLAQALRDLAQLHYCRGEYDLATEFAERAIGLHRRTRNLAGVAGGLNQIGHVLHARGRVTESITTYEAALEIWRRIEDRPGVAAIRNNLGTVYDSLGDFARAIGHYEEAVTIFRELGYGAAAALGLLNLAACYLNRGEVARARDLIDRGAQAATETGSRRTEIEALRLRAELLLASGDLGRAEELALRASEEAGALGNRTGECMALLSLGQCHLQQGRVDDADRALRRALEVAVVIGERSLVAHARLGLFRLHLLRGEGARAIAEVEEARGVTRRLPDVVVEVLSLLALGELHLFLGQGKRAAAFLEDALGRVEESGFALRLPEVLLALARADIDSGVPEDATTAIDRLTRAEAGARQADRKGLIASIAAVRAEAEIARGNPGVALELARTGLESAELLRDKVAVARLELALARARVAQGRMPAAIDQSERALAAAREVGFTEGEATAHLALAQALRADGQLEQAASAVREAASVIRGIWSALPPELRTDYDGRALARQVRSEGERVVQMLRARGVGDGPVEGAPEPSPDETPKAADGSDLDRASIQAPTEAEAEDHRAAALAEDAARRAGAETQSDGDLVAAGDAPADAAEGSEPAAGDAVQPNGSARLAAVPPPAAAPASSQQTLDGLRDSLTELYNHAFFTTQIEHEIKRAARYQRPMSVLKINIDRFKLVRDVHGQRIARRVLRGVAAILKGNLRDIDLLARYFGDEFEALLPDTDAAGAVLLADRLRAAVERETFHHGEERIEVTISIGSVTMPDDARDRDSLMCKADEALYNARSAGPNRTFSFQIESDASVSGTGGPGAPGSRKVGEDGGAATPAGREAGERRGSIDTPSSPEVGDLPGSSKDLGPADEMEQRLGRGREREIESLLLRREGRLVLSILNRITNTELDLDSMIELVAGTIVEATKGERAFFLLVDRNGDLVFKYGRNVNDEEIATEQFRISRSIAQNVAKTGKPILVAEATEDERFRDVKSVADLQLRSILCVPIRIKDDVIGILYVDHASISRRFTRDDLDFVMAVAERIAIPLNASKMFAEQQEELAETRQKLAQMRDIGTKYRYDKIIGKTQAMQKVFQLLDRVVDTTYSVVIHGESGTGKELVARAIHNNGPRKDGPFIAENCAALSETLLEAELFGHVKGAFTGADRDSKGLFELAHGGTLFLDEIGDMSERMQKKLLRVLQEGEVRPVGGKRVTKVDVRIISASNKDLKALMEDGKFRQDLYYRLNVITVHLPPLRDRREDVPLLIDNFLERSTELGSRVGPDGERLDLPDIEPQTMRAMMAYDWPGNVRELENEVNRLIAMADGAITPELLSPKVHEGTRPPAERESGFNRFLGRPLKDVEEEVMREVIIHTLKQTNWHRTKAAQILQVPTSTLFNKMKKYGIS